MKVVAPAKGCIEMDGVTGLRYKANDGIYNMHPADAKAAVKFGAFLPSMSGITRRSIGYRCTECDFGSFFAKCGRCGAPATREATE